MLADLVDYVNHFNNHAGIEVNDKFDFDDVLDAALDKKLKHKYTQKVSSSNGIIETRLRMTFSRGKIAYLRRSCLFNFYNKMEEQYKLRSLVGTENGQAKALSKIVDEMREYIDQDKLLFNSVLEYQIYAKNKTQTEYLELSNFSVSCFSMLCKEDIEFHSLYKEFLPLLIGEIYRLTSNNASHPYSTNYSLVRVIGLRDHNGERVVECKPINSPSGKKYFTSFFLRKVAHEFEIDKKYLKRKVNLGCKGDFKIFGKFMQYPLIPHPALITTATLKGLTLPWGLHFMNTLTIMHGATYVSLFRAPSPDVVSISYLPKSLDEWKNHDTRIDRNSLTLLKYLHTKLGGKDYGFVENDFTVDIGIDSYPCIVSKESLTIVRIPKRFADNCTENVTPVKFMKPILINDKSNVLNRNLKTIGNVPMNTLHSNNNIPNPTIQLPYPQNVFHQNILPIKSIEKKRAQHTFAFQPGSNDSWKTINWKINRPVFEMKLNSTFRKRSLEVKHSEQKIENIAVVSTAVPYKHQRLAMPKISSHQGSDKSYAVTNGTHINQKSHLKRDDTGDGIRNLSKARTDVVNLVDPDDFGSNEANNTKLSPNKRIRKSVIDLADSAASDSNAVTDTILNIDISTLPDELYHDLSHLIIPNVMYLRRGSIWEQMSCASDTLLFLNTTFYTNFNSPVRKLYQNELPFVGNILQRLFSSEFTDKDFDRANRYWQKLIYCQGGGFRLGTFYAPLRLLKHVLDFPRSCGESNSKIFNRVVYVHGICQSEDCSNYNVDVKITRDIEEICCVAKKRKTPDEKSFIERIDDALNYPKWAFECLYCKKKLKCYHEYENYPAVLMVEISENYRPKGSPPECIKYGSLPYYLTAIHYLGDSHFIAVAKFRNNKLFEYDGMHKNSDGVRDGACIEIQSGQFSFTVRNKKASVLYYQPNYEIYLATNGLSIGCTDNLCRSTDEENKGGINRCLQGSQNLKLEDLTKLENAVVQLIQKSKISILSGDFIKFEFCPEINDLFQNYKREKVREFIYQHLYIEGSKISEAYKFQSAGIKSMPT